MNPLNMLCKLLNVRIDIMRRRIMNQIHCMPWKTSVDNFKRSLFGRTIRHIIKSKLNLWKGIILLLQFISTNKSYHIAKSAISHFSLSIGLGMARATILQRSIKQFTQSSSKMTKEFHIPIRS